MSQGLSTSYDAMDADFLGMFDTEVPVGKTNQVLAPGLYFARRVAVLVLGSFYGNLPNQKTGQFEANQEVQICWEIVGFNGEPPEQFDVKGDPIKETCYFINGYRLWMSDSSALGKLIQAWNQGYKIDPKQPPNLVKITDAPCQLSLVVEESKSRKGVFYNRMAPNTPGVQAIHKAQMGLVNKATTDLYVYSHKMPLPAKDSVPKWLPWHMGVPVYTRMTAALEKGGTGKIEFKKKDDADNSATPSGGATTSSQASAGGVTEAPPKDGETPF